MENLTLLSCPTCQGYGVVAGGAPCPTCDRASIAAFWNGQWLVWRRRLSSAAIAEQHVEWISRAIVNGTLLLTGMVGLLVGFWQLVQLIEAQQPVQRFLSDRSIPLGFFWLSVLCDLYIFYRLDRERRGAQRISRSTRAVVSSAGSFKAFLRERQKAVDVAGAFHEGSLRAVEDAWLFARRLGQRSAEPTHLLATLLGQPTIGTLFVRLNIPVVKITPKIQHVLRAQEPSGGIDPVLSPAFTEILLRAYAHAGSDRRGTVDPPDLFAALFATRSRARDILEDLEVDEQQMRNVIAWAVIQKRLRDQWQRYRSRALWKPKGVMDRAMTAQATPVLDHFSEDLTQLARIGALPFMVDRERELAEILRIVESGAGGVLLIGHPGVGKTSMLYGIAERMATEDIPEVLKDKRLVALSAPQLVAGAGGIGELEERLAEILKEVTKSGTIVLVLENVHELVGVSSVGGQTLDLADMLAQSLKQRRFTVFGTTTPADFRRHLEGRGGLASALHTVLINEVDENGAILICEARSGTIEYRQKVFFSYAAIEAAVRLSTRYLHERFLPEKAIDVLEETAVAVAKTKGARAVVTADDVARTVSEKSGVEVTRVSEGETDKLLHLEATMHKRIVGQEEAVVAVAAALRRSRAELRDPRRPIANFLFMGPTGVGKTELAKTVAAVYFGSEGDMVRLDMSEYQDAASLARLIGAPVGFGERGGYLTESVRNNPYTILLLDELEKAHPDALNLFLQVMDDGRLTDASGRTVDFTNVILIATSNAATPYIQERLLAGKIVPDIKRELLAGQLQRWFRPEFINRFDDVIVFTPLSEPEIQKIARLLIGKVQKQLEDKGITLQVTDEAVAELAAAGFDPLYGARPLRRVIQDRVDNALATALLEKKIARRDVAILEPGGVIRVEKGEEL